MEFLASVIETIIQAALIGAVAVGGVFIGKNLRAKKNAKIAMETQKEKNAE